jgi:hypothetical protein
MTRRIITPRRNIITSRYHAKATPAPYPGQEGNAVGYAAYPGYDDGGGDGSGNGDENSGLTTSSWPPTIANGGVDPSAPDWGQGTQSNPTRVISKDFISKVWGYPNFIPSLDGTANTPMVQWVDFNGCRFQSLVITGACTNMSLNAQSPQTEHAGNLNFNYCSWTPLAAPEEMAAGLAAPSQGWLNPKQPGAWPSAGVGSGFSDYADPKMQEYGIPYNDSTQFNVAAFAAPGTVINIDHCDFWGGGNLINAQTGPQSSMGQVNFIDCWLHDQRWGFGSVWDPTLAYPSGYQVTGSDGEQYNVHFWPPDMNPDMPGWAPPGKDPVTNTEGWWYKVTNDHTDGIIPSQPNAGGGNVLMRHCTIASLGNTNAVAYQYNNKENYFNLEIDDCYLSGYGYTCAIGTDPAYAGHGPNYDSGMRVTNTIFATDIAFIFGFLQHAAVYANQFDQSQCPTNLWRNNKLRVYPGDTWSGLSVAQDGLFLWPDGTFNTEDWSR